MNFSEHNITNEIEITVKLSNRDTSSLKFKKKNNKKTSSIEILKKEEGELRNLKLKKNIVDDDVRIKPLFVWMLRTPVEKEQKGLENNLNKDRKEITFNTTDHDLSIYRNAHLVGQTSTIFVKGIDINAMEEDIKEFFLEIEKPLEIRYKYDENGERPGFAFITFSSPELASQAVIRKNRGYICDRYVYTDWAKERRNNFQDESNRIKGPKHLELKGTTTRIWIGNLNRKITEDHLRKHFNSIGDTSDIYIIGRDPSRPRIAYLSFSSTGEANKAVEEMQGSEIMGQNIRIDWANERRNSTEKKRNRELSQKEKGCVTIFVGGLTNGVTDDDLIKMFEDCGEISQIRKIQKDGVFKGIAFIEFSKTEATDKAVAMNGIEYKGKSLRIDYAASRKK